MKDDGEGWGLSRAEFMITSMKASSLWKPNNKHFVFGYFALLACPKNDDET